MVWDDRSHRARGADSPAPSATTVSAQPARLLGLQVWHVGVVVAAAFVLIGPSACSTGTPAFDESVEVPGDLTRFDALGALPAVTAFAGSDAQLVELRTSFVREDGTQDLQASYVSNSPVATYVFERPNQEQSDPAVPVGARPPVAPFETVEIEIARPHVVTVSSGSDPPRALQHNGMRLHSRRPATERSNVPEPACSFVDLWRAAKARGAPAGAVAAITYGPDGYEFAIDAAGIHLLFNASCQPQAA